MRIVELTDEIVKQVLVVHLMISHEAEDVQLLTHPIKLEEVGVVWNDTVDDFYPSVVEIDLVFDRAYREIKQVSKRVHLIACLRVIHDVPRVTIPTTMVLVHDHG